MSQAPRKKKLAYLFAVETNHIKGAGALDVDTVNAHECVGHGLASVGSNGVTERIAYNVNRHAGLDTDTVGVLHALGCDSE